jgi:hypothetical protein
MWLAGCVPYSAAPSQSLKWSTGFWLWRGSAADTERFRETVDVIFIHVGYISDGQNGPQFGAGSVRKRQLTVYGYLPDKLPAAREYWLVWRYERQGVPDLEAAPQLAREFARLTAVAARRHVHVAGLQLDIDSPTAALPQYATFLRTLRKGLSQGSEISITALLDWFRSGTAIDDVIRETDEFVPQFYDVQNPYAYDDGIAIAARVDASQWGPAFRRFGKRYRVGISTFGRAYMVRREEPSPARSFRRRLFRDLAPIDVATSRTFQMQAARNQAGELVLSYQAGRRADIGYERFEPGDTVQFILAAPESIRAAVESARQMGGAVAGVVFFRWPTSDERLTMQPGEALGAAGLAPSDDKTQTRVHIVDGQCAAVECVDMYLLSASPLSPKALQYVIRSSAELEYFVPEQNVPVRMRGPSRLEVSLPPYCGRGRLYLGRAVSLKRSEYSIEQEQ